MATTVRMTAKVVYSVTLTADEEADFFMGGEVTTERLRRLMDDGELEALALRDMVLDEGLDVMLDEQWEVVALG